MTKRISRMILLGAAEYTAEWMWGTVPVSPAFVTRFSHFRAEMPAAARVKWWWRCPQNSPSSSMISSSFSTPICTDVKIDTAQTPRRWLMDGIDAFSWSVSQIKLSWLLCAACCEFFRQNQLLSCGNFFLFVLRGRVETLTKMARAFSNSHF